MKIEVRKDSRVGSGGYRSPGFSFSWWIGLLALGIVTGYSAIAESPTPAATPVPTASVAPVEAPAVAKLTAADAKSLLKEFQRAQSSELKALSHRQKLELRELKAAQKARQKEWERREKEARHKFFAQNHKGPDRRAYIKDFIARRESFIKMISDERSQRSNEQDVRIRSLRQDQGARLREFKEALQKGERPADRLWPGSG
jgi:hypothetical protein